MSASFSVVLSRTVSGLCAPLVTVEAHVSGGLPSLSIVGLPEVAIKESRDRVRSAILNSQFEFPYRRITVNLAPADLPKEGTGFDLPIALGILAASRQLDGVDFSQYEFSGELALSGELRAAQHVLPLIRQAALSGREVIVPRANAYEASLCGYPRVRLASHLLEVVAHLMGGEKLRATELHDDEEVVGALNSLDLVDVDGQMLAKRGLEIAAAGGHNLLFFGPPGTGKTLLASRLPGILPLLSHSEALDVMSIRSLSGQALDVENWRQRPFRAPHHTASAVALVGGGSRPKPGEVSLAHHGVLFLDELPEFDRRVLEVLREPIEAGTVRISRAAQQVEFPAKFQIVAAMNPCPCGYSGDKQRTCRCSPDQIARYRRKISGPLLDRFDLHIEVSRLDIKSEAKERSVEVRKRVLAAREMQGARGTLNAQLGLAELKAHCVLSDEVEALLSKAVDSLGLSKRAYHRIIKVARTIADLAGRDSILSEHVVEAIGFRHLDREAR